VIGSVLDAEIQIILLETVQNHRKTRTKEHSSEALGVIGEEDDEKAKDETCLVTREFNEVRSESSYFSDGNSSVDDIMFDSEYYKFKKMSWKWISNKRMKNQAKTTKPSTEWKSVK
ncbi:hypothetical protein Tco_1398910, partial [Tanacetum coccineum]